MTESDRLAGRNGEIWRKHVRGRTEEHLAAEYNLTQQRISQIIAEVRDSIPEQTRAQVVQAELDLLLRLRDEVLELWDAKAVPVTVGKDGDILRDPETQEVVRDHSGRLAGVKMALNISESLRRMVGADSASKVDLMTHGEAEATQRAAQDARQALTDLDGEGQ